MWWCVCLALNWNENRFHFSWLTFFYSLHSSVNHCEESSQRLFILFVKGHRGQHDKLLYEINKLWKVFQHHNTSTHWVFDLLFHDFMAFLGKMKIKTKYTKESLSQWCRLFGRHHIIIYTHSFIFVWFRECDENYASLAHVYTLYFWHRANEFHLPLISIDVDVTCFNQHTAAQKRNAWNGCLLLLPLLYDVRNVECISNDSE